MTSLWRGWVGDAARFGLVGVLQNGLNIASFAAMTAAGVHYRAAAVAAGVLAFLVSFVLNRQWTFTGQTMGVTRQGMRYLLVFASAILVGVLLLSLFVDVLGVTPVPAQVAAILLVAPLSFMIQRTWVFHEA